MHITHTYNTAAKPYGVSGRWAQVSVLRASAAGRNARGTAGHKRGWGGSQPKGAKRAKRQGAERMGNVPTVRTTNWPTSTRAAKDAQYLLDMLGEV